MSLARKEVAVKLKFKVTFKRGQKVVATVEGERTLQSDELTVGDVEKIQQTEQFLEKLTGCRVHIDQVL